MDHSIINTSRIKLRPEKRKEFFQTVGRLLGVMTSRKGCRDFRCYVDMTDGNSSLLMSEWETESDLMAYLQSEDFAVLRGAIMVLSNQSTGFETLVNLPVGAD